MIVFLNWRKSLPVRYNLNSALNSLLRICEAKLNRNQLLLLKYSEKEELNATGLIKKVSEEENIAKSTLWYNLRSLKEFKLIEFGDGNPVKLNYSAKLILNKFLKGGDKGEL